MKMNKQQFKEEVERITDNFYEKYNDKLPEHMVVIQETYVNTLDYKIMHDEYIDELYQLFKNNQ